MSADDLTALREAYLEAVLTPDARAARLLVDGACGDGVPVARIYLEVLHPALEMIGARWEQASLTVAQEHIASQITQVVLAGLASRLTRRSGPRDRRAAVTCSPGEMHVIGGQMVADFMEADGWEVSRLGADVPTSALVALVEAEALDVVAMSTALPAHLLQTGAACAALRGLERPPFLVVGGQAFGGDEARALAVGADAFARGPAELLQLLDARF